VHLLPCCTLRACVEQRKRAGRAQARRMLREADSNGDGKVSRDEFHALFTQSTRPDELGQYDARYAPLESVEA